MRKATALALALLMMALAYTARAEAAIVNKAQLNQAGMKVGVNTGSASSLIAERELPNAEIVFYEDSAVAYEAVAQGKVDAYVFDRVQLRQAIENGRKGVRLLDENLDGMIEVGVGISPKSAIPDIEGKLREFLNGLRQDGTLEDMYRRWAEVGDTTMPDIRLPDAPKYHLRVGTAGIVPPFSYYVGAKLHGYDIEMARRFAAWLDADLEFKVYDFGAIVPAAVSGDVDCIMSDLNITEERREAIPFSDIIYESPVGIMVRGDAQGGAAAEGLKDGDSPARGAASAGITALDQLDGRRVGVQTGTTAAQKAAERLPHAKVEYFSTFPDMAVALENNKIDGFLGDWLVLSQMARESSAITVLEERLYTYDCGFVLAKNERGHALCDELNAWIKDMRQRGELDRILKKWTEGPESEQTVPDYRSLPAPKGVLTMATEGTFPPMNFYRGEDCVGMEIELCALFCQANGYGLNVTTMDFGSGMLQAVATGKVDFAISGIAITEERKQSVLFSDPYYTGGMSAAVLKVKEAAPAGAYERLDELENKSIGVTTGSVQVLQAQERFPNAKLLYFTSEVDMLSALRSHKIDAFADSEALIRYIMASNSDLTYLDERLGENMKTCAIFPKTRKGQALCDEYSGFVRQIRQDGTYDGIERAWFGADASKAAVPEAKSLPATNGKLRVAADTTLVPFMFIRDGRPAGIDADILVRFCKEKGYGLEIVQTDFAGIIPAVISGKVDFACGGIAYTPERAQSVLFSEPTYEGRSAVAVLKASRPATQDTPSFWEGIASSFNKTFLRENRWQLFVKGVITTLVITLATIFFGTALGFLVFMLCRNGNPVANRVTRFCLWLVQGMPMVVLLMILYYIIFGSVAINGIVVAVIGFTLTFGASVFGLLKMGVGAVEAGQYEAAYALGYSNRRTFFRIILPQALPHVLPAYKGEIVGLIKATAVVGYIAVQDLTKMGDIVRSRTYEAFFPLIAVTVIYFLLEGLIGFFVSRVSVNFNPKRRKPGQILKGVKTDDPN